MRNDLPSAPLILNWTLTNKCNFGCQHCYSRTDENEELDSETLRDLVGKVAAAKVLSVNFGGGEPLLRADLFQIARFAKDQGIAVSMNSNGYLVGRETAVKLKEAGFTKVGISVDSTKAEVHDEFRGMEGSHRRALEALGHLKEVGIEASISAVICRINNREIEALVGLAISSGCSSINLHNFKCSGLGFVNRDSLDLGPDEWRRFYEEALVLKERTKNLRISLEDPVIASLGHRDEESMVPGSVCGKLSLNIKSNGDVTPCGFIPIVVGNLLRDDLVTLWKTSPTLWQMRHKEARGKCVGCSHYEDCLGGCTARALALSGDLNSPDPHCWYDEPE